MSGEASSSRLRDESNSIQSEFHGYVDGTKLLRKACADLVPGQMISIPEFTLMDSMAALQIMDPRMDSGIFPIPDHLIADCDRLPKDGSEIPPFEPQSELSAEDICWIMDRLLACEIEWHKGGSLSQTIYTCRYLHCLASLDANACLASGKEPNWLVLRVLQPFLIALVKCIGLVWDEVAKGNVADGEDFNCDKAGVSLLEDTRPDKAIDWLQNGISFIQAMQGDASLTREQCDALLIRLQLRKNLLLAISIFSKIDPSLKLGRGLDPMQVLSELPMALQGAHSQLDWLGEHLQNSNPLPLFCLMSPSFSDAPSGRAMSAFDTEYSRRPSYNEEINAPSAPPPPQPLELIGPRETIAIYKTILNGLYEARQLVSEDASWAKWKSFLEMKAINFQRKTTLAYIRSLWQSVICTEGIIGLQFTLNWITDSFFEQEAGLSHGTLSRIALSPQAAEVAGDASQASLTKRIKWFMERLAGQLVNHLCSLAQNRSRGRRSLAASYPTLLELSAEAAAIDTTVAEIFGEQTGEGIQLASAVQVLTLGVMQSIVYSGFELDLYRVEESAVVYWIGHRIAEEKILLIESMQTEESSEVLEKRSRYLQAQFHSTKAVAAASKAMEFLFNTQPMVRQTRPPWQPSLEDEDVLNKAHGTENNGTEDRIKEDIDRVSFCKRFKWLRGKGRPEGIQTLDNLWSDFQVDMKIMKTKSTKERLNRSSHYLSEAVDELKQASESHSDQHISALIVTLQNVHRACTNEKDQTTSSCLVPLTFHQTTSHPWFPVLLHTQS